MCLKVNQMTKNEGLIIPLGDNEGVQKEISLLKAKHILVAGENTRYKSAFLHKIIEKLLKSPKEQISLHLVDLDGKEFNRYKDNVNLIYPLLANKREEFINLCDVMEEIEARKVKFEKKEVFNLKDYNTLSNDEEKLPYIVVIINEAKKFLHKKAETTHVLKRIAAWGHGFGVHLILSTSKVGFNRLVPNLKANLQTRVCFSTKSKKDSFFVLHETGAEKLKEGEFLLKTPSDSKTTLFFS